MSMASWYDMLSISIIIPIYNVEPYVRHCLESVMAQDCAEATVECILVGDCGQDGSMAIVHSMLTNYNGSAVFMLLLFPPLKMLQRWSVFRRIYYRVETIVLRVSHLTDFLHRKNVL